MKNSIGSFTKEKLLEVLKDWYEYANQELPQSLGYSEEEEKN